MLIVQDVDLTPNPQALKFVMNERLLVNATRDFPNKEIAEKDPLAKGLFEIEGVVGVFYMDRFITIEKRPDTAWGPIQKGFVTFLKSFDKSTIPVEEDLPQMSSLEESEMLKQINDILDQRVRPALAGDGGGLQVVDLEGNILKIRYQGACGTCPSSIRGTLVAIENLLKREVNPAIEVISADL
ncbi:MAG: NifU family protein [Melioribacteraceae bacterium]|nr:NifU family protein [Melioribacteraceae bacterium]MCF8265289.1 NifU family protein [Melioribacteraceae bacterium]MCF8412618.1 NifU family protein [Melioribacteraceae bacterium]MCF8431520.1 NifU family protein [Melioribacteraceae bacterium]